MYTGGNLIFRLKMCLLVLFNSGNVIESFIYLCRSTHELFQSSKYQDLVFFHAIIYFSFFNVTAFLMSQKVVWMSLKNLWVLNSSGPNCGNQSSIALWQEIKTFIETEANVINHKEIFISENLPGKTGWNWFISRSLSFVVRPVLLTLLMF